MTVAYRYRAQLVRVVDGDTYELDVDLGFHVHTRITARLRGWNCEERYTETGKLATAAAVAIITGPLIVETEKVHQVADTQSFARYVADVWTDAGHVGDLLAARGLATPR